MSRYKCLHCEEEHGTDNVAAVCIQCFDRLRKQKERHKIILENTLDYLRSVICSTPKERIDAEEKRTVNILIKDFEEALAGDGDFMSGLTI